MGMVGDENRDSGGTLIHHNGHLAMAEEARAYLNLTEVLFLPSGQPWMKSERMILRLIIV